MLTVRGAPAAGEAAILDHEYRDFAAVLEATVDETGNVDYRALNSDPSRLQQCLSLMSRVHASDYQQWSREQRLAYLINLYNAHTIGLIARHYPVKTIKDIGNLWQGPWGQPVVLLFGRRTSLDYLANKLIHPLFDDPRIYFALCFGEIGRAHV